MDLDRKERTVRTRTRQQVREALETRLKYVRQFAEEARRRSGRGEPAEFGGSSREYWEGVRDATAGALYYLDE